MDEEMRDYLKTKFSRENFAVYARENSIGLVKEDTFRIYIKGHMSYISKGTLRDKQYSVNFLATQKMINDGILSVFVKYVAPIIFNRKGKYYVRGFQRILTQELYKVVQV